MSVVCARSACVAVEAVLEGVWERDDDSTGRRDEGEMRDGSRG